jgi:hypothetical protein
MYSKVRYLISILGNLFCLSMSSRPKACGQRVAKATTRSALHGRTHQNKAVKTKQILQVFKVGCPIRKSMDQSLFAAPHSLSQRITSFFACACQGIHQMPLIHLFVLIVYAHPYLLDLEFLSFSLPRRGSKSGHPDIFQPSRTSKSLITFYNQAIS